MSGSTRSLAVLTTIAVVGVLVFRGAMQLQATPTQYGSDGPASSSLVLILLVAATIGSLLLVYIPRWQTRSLRATAVEKWTAENEARKTLAQIVGGGAILLTFMSSNASLDVSRRELHVSQATQLATVLSNATEHLGAAHKEGAPNRETRIGGLFALESIAGDEPYKTIVLETLAAYIRENSPRTEKIEDLSQDLLVAVSILRRQSQQSRQFRFNLRNTNLKSAHLESAKLPEAELWNTVLRGAHLQGADLRWASLFRSDLASVDFRDADLTGAYLKCAQGLTPSQIKAARNWEKAFYDSATISALNLPPDHNESVVKQLQIGSRNAKLYIDAQQCEGAR